MRKLDRDKAACRDKPREFFFPTGKGGRKAKNSPKRAAINVSTETMEQYNSNFCRENNCEILSDCLQFALENNEEGVWGGTSTGQRYEIMRRRNIGPFKNRQAKEA